MSNGGPQGSLFLSFSLLLKNILKNISKKEGNVEFL